MSVRSLAHRIRLHCRHHGAIATARFLASRVLRRQRHVVFEAVLEGAPENISWSEGELLKVIDQGNVDCVIDSKLRQFLGGDDAADNLDGVRNGNKLFVVMNGEEYQHCGYVLFRTPQTRIIGEPAGAPLIACCFTAPAARGHGFYRKALISELRHLWAMGYRRVVIETSPDNLASQKGIEAAGFRLCREVRAWILLNRLVFHRSIEASGATSKCFLL